ncbi:MAG: zf-HC2 domain-containing protein [Chitinispirillaceae bacterium]|nr:zf-HC2 domain-containing protein [Chitinispirillaceae bacterium]
MSKCKKNRILISRMIDRDLSVEERNVLEKHIQICDRCFSVLKGYKKVSNVLDTIFLEKKDIIKANPQLPGESFFWKSFRMNRLIPLTGFATIACILITLFFSYESSSKKVLLLLNHSTISLMSLPLSSFSYYGYTVETPVQSQFSYAIDCFDYTEVNPVEIYRGYESPLFNDKISDDSHFCHSSQFLLE